MGPKPIQDVAPPPQAANQPSEPLSGPEIVGDIPVRAPTQQARDEQSQPAKEGDSSFIVSAPPTLATDKDKEKPKTKEAQPKPILAIVVAALAAICLAAGAYLKFFANN